MDPLTRLSIFLFQVWRNPPSRRTALFMLAALAIAVLIVVVEHFGYWPASWQVNPRITRPGISRV
ncbi:hypothetical protein [Roseomonas marmotae]|uniref:ABC transporter permease n=1 Tax=Roseomonas marmotae TaxID=2768161 RepID=A0ABS3KC69_9PROT|nr:hypothetical protein [Roseomonas marmotae]MBO1075061.1 hypothetical protein [Roseomonas marmotae]QTI79908.1 hypothetical protein IAI58_03745 [Roseomonas marmotae]